MTAIPEALAQATTDRAAIRAANGILPSLADRAISDIRWGNNQASPASNGTARNRFVRRDR